MNGRAAARTFVALGRPVALWDVDEGRARAAAMEVGAAVARSQAEALAADVVVTVTPGKQILLPEGSLLPGQHVSLVGADGPGKAEIAVAELARAHVFCDDWEQASHGGDLAAAVEAGASARGDVTMLGDVLTGTAPGRRVSLPGLVNERIARGRREAARRTAPRRRVSLPGLVTEAAAGDTGVSRRATVP